MLNFYAPSKFFICSFLLFFSSFLIAQNNFQKGSYIDKNGNKNEGFIYNLDWQYSPTEIKFKNVLDSESKQITIDDIQEFEIDGYSKYIKYEGLVDDSSAIHAELGFNRNPNWKTVKVLLKVLVDSDASLFFYNCEDYSRYFYSINSKGLKIQQLVYKEYYLDGGKTEIGNNFQFRQQLANDFDCGSMKKGLSGLKYNRKDLEKYFLEYNKCNGAVVDLVSNSLARKKVKFNYLLLAGISSVDFATSHNNINISGNIKHQFDQMYSYPIGAEIEINIPINNYKWSLYFQPSYQGFSSDESANGDYGSLSYKVNYKSINLPIGLRHYFFLNNINSKIYLNGAVGFNVDMSSKVTLANYSDYDFETLVFGLNFGAGYVLNNRYSFEFRYSNSADIINLLSFNSDFNSLGLLFKYQLNK